MSGRLLLTAIAVVLSAGGCASLGSRGSAESMAPSSEGLSESFGGGLAAASAGDLVSATERLVEVREVCGDSPLGQQALLLMSVLQIDPRNARRNPSLAAELAATYLTRPVRLPWTDPIAEGVYVTALEMGGRVPSLPETDSAPLELQGAGMGLSGPAQTSVTASAHGVHLGLIAAGADFAANLLEQRIRAAAHSAGMAGLPEAVLRECEEMGTEAQPAPPAELPNFEGASVPKRLSRLQRDKARLKARVGELQAELDRIHETLRP